jgi:hypothetical protein
MENEIRFPSFTFRTPVLVLGSRTSVVLVLKIEPLRFP